MATSPFATIGGAATGAMKNAMPRRRRGPLMFGAGMQSQTPFEFGAPSAPPALPGGGSGSSMFANIGNAVTGAIGNATQLAPKRPQSIMEAILASLNPTQAQPQTSNMLTLLREIQANRDPVGQHNNRSNLPSNAAGSTSPFATGFFGPQTVGDSTVTYNELNEKRRKADKARYGV